MTVGRKLKLGLGSVIVVLDILCLFAVAGSGLLLYERWQNLKAIYNQTAEVRAQAGDLNILEQVFKETATERAALPGFFLQAASLPDFIGSIERLAEEDGVSLNIKDAHIFNDQLLFAELNMDASAGFNALLNFIRNTEKTPRYLWFTKIAMLPASGGPEEERREPFWRASLTLRVALAPEAEQ